MPILGDSDVWSREGAIAHALADLWGRDDHPIERPDGDPVISRLEMTLAYRRALDSRRLTMRQHIVLHTRFGLGLGVTDTARRLSLDRNTVAVDEHDAIEELIRWVWDDPDWRSGPRLRPWQRAAVLLAKYLR